MISRKKVFSCLVTALMVFFGGVLIVGDAMAKKDFDTPDVGTGAAGIQGRRAQNGEPNTISGSSSSQTQDGDGIFSSLVNTGRTVFNDLRELIYIVAGFGIIAVGVGGIFGNLNWKWLGAIIISLVIIATAGELVKQMLGDAHGIINESDDVTTSMQE